MISGKATGFNNEPFQQSVAILAQGAGSEPLRVRGARSQGSPTWPRSRRGGCGGPDGGEIVLALRLGCGSSE